MNRFRSFVIEALYYKSIGKRPFYFKANYWGICSYKLNGISIPKMRVNAFLASATQNTALRQYVMDTQPLVEGAQEVCRSSEASTARRKTMSPRRRRLTMFALNLDGKHDKHH